MIYAHPDCVRLAGVEPDTEAPPCDAVCELCLRPGVGLVLIRGVSRFDEELLALRRKVTRYHRALEAMEMDDIDAMLDGR